MSDALLNNNTAAALFYRAPKYIQDKGVLASIAVATNLDGSPFTLADATRLPEQPKNKFLVGSATECIRRQPSQRAYAVDKSVIDKIMSWNRLVPFEEEDNFLGSYSDFTVTTLCINDNEQWDKYNNSTKEDLTLDW